MSSLRASPTEVSFGVFEPGSIALITRRCTQRQFLLRPDRETNNAFTYCLIEAALRYGIEVLLPCAMSTTTTR
jgi:hypothetical protein